MMHPYFAFAGGTEVMHTGIIENEGVRKAIAHFELPTGADFHSARCELPSYTWES